MDGEKVILTSQKSSYSEKEVLVHLSEIILKYCDKDGCIKISKLFSLHERLYETWNFNVHSTLTQFIQNHPSKFIFHSHQSKGSSQTLFNKVSLAPSHSITLRKNKKENRKSDGDIVDRSSLPVPPRSLPPMIGKKRKSDGDFEEERMDNKKRWSYTMIQSFESHKIRKQLKSFEKKYKELKDTVEKQDKLIEVLKNEADFFESRKIKDENTYLKGKLKEFNESGEYIESLKQRLSERDEVILKLNRKLEKSNINSMLFKELKIIEDFDGYYFKEFYEYKCVLRKPKKFDLGEKSTVEFEMTCPSAKNIIVLKNNVEMVYLKKDKLKEDLFCGLVKVNSNTKTLDVYIKLKKENYSVLVLSFGVKS